MAKYVMGVYGASAPPPPPPTLTITTNSLPNGTRNQVYSATMVATGGTAPYTWTVQSGSLGSLNLNSATGVITGTQATATTLVVNIRVTDSLGATDDSGNLNIIINDVASLAISTGSTLTGASVNAAFSRTLIGTGGTLPYTWTTIGGGFPAWATLNSSTGVISGTPTTETSYNFTVRLTDADTTFTEKVFNINVAAEGAVEGPHDFYNEQKVLGDVWGGEDVGHYSLRTPTSIAALDESNNSTTQVWQYVFGSDTTTDPQDAARMWMGHNLPTQLIKTFSAANTGSILVIADHYFAQEWVDNLRLDPVDVLAHKFQRFRGASQSGSQSIYIEARTKFPPSLFADGYVGQYDLRLYGQGTDEEYASYCAEWGVRRYGAFDPPGYDDDGVRALGEGVRKFRPNEWQRNWYFVEMDVPGTSFTGWNTYVAPTAPGYLGYPLGTRNIVSAVVDGADTIVTVDTPNPYWADSANGNPTGFSRATISGHSNGALDGSYVIQQIDPSNVRIIGVTVGGGTGGTISKHYNRFTWWNATESEDAVALFYGVPVQPLNSNADFSIKQFRNESNTSNQAWESVKYWRLAVSPTIAASAVIETPEPHGLVAGDWVYNVNVNNIQNGRSYPVTVLSPTTFSIPYTTTQLATIVTSNSQSDAGTYGTIIKALRCYARNWVFRRNPTIDVSEFRRPKRG